jgi:CRISPR-associated endonuclease/helicase Cas3
MLESGLPDLAVFLAAAHHGKVRLSIRSFPNEATPQNPSIRFARGIWEGDQLPMADLGGGTIMPATQIDLSYMEMGDSQKGPSWLARMIALRDEKSIGPFRMGYYEALVRAADWRASGKVRSQDV